MGGSKSQLFEIAESQQGVFTARQAELAGYDRKNHHYQLKAGNWTREYRGIYRLVNYPVSDEAEYVIWSLWSRNRDQEVQGVYSHETALSMHGLSDVNPSRLHLTVPVSFRRNSEIPSLLNLHFKSIPRDSILQKQGYCVTNPYQTIMDVSLEGSLSREFVVASIQQGIQMGLITEREKDSVTLNEKLPDWVKEEFHQS